MLGSLLVTAILGTVTFAPDWVRRSRWAESWLERCLQAAAQGAIRFVMNLSDSCSSFHNPWPLFMVRAPRLSRQRVAALQCNIAAGQTRLLNSRQIGIPLQGDCVPRWHPCACVRTSSERVHHNESRLRLARSSVAGASMLEQRAHGRAGVVRHDACVHRQHVRVRVDARVHDVGGRLLRGAQLALPHRGCAAHRKRAHSPGLGALPFVHSRRPHRH